MIFNHIKEVNDKFTVVNRNNIIYIFLYIRENNIAGSFYCGTIGNSIHIINCNHMTCL